MMIEIGVLVDKLNSMETPKEIAEFLMSQGIKGQKSSARQCPISTWISRESGRVASTVLGAVFELEIGNPSHMKDRFDLSETVDEFIMAFDKRQYPSLISDEGGIIF
jgi:hypothetical protein